MPGTPRDFWTFVDASGGPDACHPWTGAHDPDGYGLFTPRGGKTRRAHREAMRLSGFLIEGVHVLHRCDNPPCCNPRHLRRGTNAENMADMKAKGRGAVGLRNGAHTQPAARRIGSLNGQSKLTEQDIPAIRARLEAGETPKVIAKAYGVSYGAIWFIRTGRAWKHVA